MMLIFVPGFAKVSFTVLKIWKEHISVLKITKGHPSVKTLAGVTVLIFCI